MALCFTVCSQTRYFEFRQPFNNTTTSFIVATSDNSLINEVLYDITLPVAQRRFISGNVINGHGGFNHDGTVWYTWHYIPNEWQLTVSNVEYCDGISSLIGSNPALIAGETIYFCPWESYPFQEVDNPGLSVDELNTNIQTTLYPNPAANKVHFLWSGTENLAIKVYNITGQKIFTTLISKQNNEIDITNLSVGLYFVHMSSGNEKGIEKLIVQH